MARKAPKFCHDVRNKIKRWTDYWKINIDQYHEFMAFVMGNQWTDYEAKLFEDYNKIPLTMNKLGVLINHLLGNQRQNTPNIQVVPDESVPEKTAEVREALIKDITFSSHSKVVFQQAFQQAAVGGFGAFGIATEYEGKSFDQVIRIFAIKDPTKCYWDMAAESPCKTDGMIAGYQVRVSREKVRQIYGKKIEQSIPSSSSDDTLLAFDNDDSITFINHYERQYDTEKLYQAYDIYDNPRTLTSDDIKEAELVEDDDGVEYYVIDGIQYYIRDKRELPKYTIKHYLIAGDYILDETEFPSEQLPIVFVDQNSYWDKKGKQICRPFVKDAKDAQRFLNYVATMSAHILKVSRYDQFLVSKENVRSPDTQAVWRDPATYQGGLVFDESPNGIVPQRLTAPELPQSFIQQYQRALLDIQSGTGMYDTQMGEQGNEISGAAIDARTQRGSYNTYVPFDSLNRAITVAGEIINEMIPSVYDAERSMMLQMPDAGLQPITINQMADPYGAQIENDMTKGSYKIRLLPGASYEGQKTEALQSMQLVLQANPQLFNLIDELFVENLPLPNNIELRNRLKTIVPPEIIEAGKTGQPLPPKQQEPTPEQQAAIMMAQAKLQDIELKKAELQRKMTELQMKDQQHKMDLQLKVEQLDKDRIEAAAQLQEQLMRYAAETHRTNSDAQMNHADNIVKILTHNPKLDTKI
jgi:hypothetical protein